MATITEEQNSMRLAQSRRRMRPYGEIPPQDFTAPEEKTETDAMEKRRLMQAEFAQQQQAAMLEWQMTEEKRQQLASLQLAQARRTQTQDAETKDGSKDKDKAEQQEKIAPVVWGMLFAAAGLFSLIGYLADLLVPFIALVINYCVVFLIWLWATVPFILASLPGLAIDGLKLPFRPIFFWRYLIGAAVPLAIVMVHTSEKLPKYLFVISIAAIIALSIIIDALTFSRYPYTFRQAYQQKILPKISSQDKIVTVLPSFAEVAYYRQRFGIKNDLIVLPEGLVQFSGKSLLDAYVENQIVTIDEAPSGNYFELRPGPSLVIRD